MSESAVDHSQTGEDGAGRSHAAEYNAAVLDLGDDHAWFINSIVEFLPDMVFVKSAADLRFVHFNRRAEELLGYRREDLIGKSDFDFFPVEQAEAFVAKDREVLAGGKVVEVAAEPIDTAHGPRILHTKKIPICDAAGVPRYLLGMSEDITERFEAERASVNERHERSLRVQRLMSPAAFTVHYQPIVDLKTGHVVGAEALSRFPGLPYRPPDQWFNEAATVGLGTELELTALQLALADLSGLPRGSYLSINVSPNAVFSPRFLPLLANQPGERIVLELTEHFSVEDYGALATALAPLRAMGVRLAVDDAGAGYASLRHILNLRPDIIKLDITLTRGIDQDPARRALASALLWFRDEIGAQVVAEGIETHAELSTLASLGLPYGQGFLLGRPQPLPLPFLVESGRAPIAG